MNATRLIGIVLLVLGALGLIYGSFSFTHDETAAKVGPLEIQVEKKETVNVPLWAGIGLMAVGGLALGFGGRR